MRKFLLILLLSIVFKNLNGQAAGQKPTIDTLINSMDGKVYHVILRQGQNPPHQIISTPAFRKPLINNRVVLSFSNGTLESSWVGDQQFGPCDATLCVNNGSFTAFTTYCLTNNTEIKAAWIGIVKRNKIQGIFSWVNQDGTVMKYYFMGEGKEKEIENNIPSDTAF